MSFAAGARLGPYEIVTLIGTGGMGEVYKARDTRLNRPVAIKLLPSDHRADPDRRRRFEREAQAVAALAHPHICVLHDVGCHEGCDFLVMEYLEGETLSTRLQAGRLDIDHVLRCAIQICDALDKAHHQGIIHRDLKPANIMLTDDGVKVLDFGLAKLQREVEPGTKEIASTDSSTTPGIILGTLPYMAPEQLERAEVDQRTDIFALGAVLYEMVSGRRAFGGDSQASLIAAILKGDPEPLANVNPSVPPNLDRLINKCLAKDPGARWQTARDLADELKWIASGASHHTSWGSRHSPLIGWKTITIALLVATAVGALLWRSLLGRDEVRELRQQRVTFSGDIIMSALSPDGRTAAFVAGEPGGNNRVIVQELDGMAGAPIWTDRDVMSVSWLPDGSHVVVVGNQPRGVWLVPSLGGTPRRVANSGKMVTSSPDGAAVALTEEGLLGFNVVSLADGATRTVTMTGFHRVIAIDWHARTNRLVLTTADDNDEKVWSVWSVTSDGKDQSRLYTSNQFVRAICTSPVSDVVYAMRQQRGSLDLVRIPMYADPGATSVLLTGLPTTAMAYRCSVSANGQRLLYGRRESLSSLWRLDIKGGTTQATSMTQGARNFWHPSVSPDGLLVAATTGAESSPQLVKVAIGGGEPVLLGEGVAPVWSSDGQRIAFISRRSGSARVWTSGTSGQSPKEVKDSAVGDPPLAWLPDGRLAWQTPDRRNYRIRDLFTGRDEYLFRESPFGGRIFDPRISPRGDQLALGSEPGLWLVSWPSRQLLWLAPRIRPIGWSPDSEWIYSISDANQTIVRLSPRTRETETIGRFSVGLAPHTCDLTPNRDALVCSLVEQKSDGWVMSNFDPAVR